MCAWTRLTGEAVAVGDGRDGGMRILSDLADRFARDHGDGQRDIDAARARPHRDGQSRIRRLMDRIRHACGLAAEQENIAVGKGKVGIGDSGFGGQQHQPPRVGRSPVLEGVPVDMPGQIGHFEVIHAGTFQRPVGERKAGWLDDVDAKAEASGEAQDCPGVAGDVRLVERDAETVVHFRVFLISGRTATRTSKFRRLLDWRVVISCEVEYTPLIVNPNRWRGYS